MMVMLELSRRIMFVDDSDDYDDSDDDNYDDSDEDDGHVRTKKKDYVC